LPAAAELVPLGESELVSPPLLCSEGESGIKNHRIAAKCLTPFLRESFMFLSDTDTRDLSGIIYEGILQLAKNRPLTDARALHIDANMRKAAEKITGVPAFPTEARPFLVHPTH